MTWRAVARKDFRDAVRARTLWAVSALFVLLAGGIAVAYATFDEVSGGDPTALGVMFFVASVVGTFISLAAILVCYKAIAGERESGTIKILLSLPHSRRDVVLGKLLGRTAVLAIPAALALVIGVVIAGALIGDFAPVATLAFAAVALLFAFAYVGIMVGISGLTGSTARAAAMAVGFFVVFELLWDIVSLGLAFVANGFVFPDSPAAFPDWLFLVNQVPPSSSFVTSLTAVIPDAPGAAAGGQSAAQVDAFFGTPWIGVVALVFWATVPVLLGYARFRRADL